MSAIYYCPETSMMIPATNIPGTIPVGAFVSNTANTSHEYYSLPASASYPPGIHHHHHHGLPPSVHHGLLSDYEYNSMLMQLNHLNLSGRGQMPEWLFDEDGNFTVTLQDIVELDLFFICVRDKKGSQFIQDNFPTENSPLRRKLYEKLFESQSMYNLAMDMFGNFVIQKMIVEAKMDYGPKMLQMLSQQAADMAFNRFSCRVLQKAIECYPASILQPILNAFRGFVLAMGTEQSANHVLQKVIATLAPEDYRFIIDEICLSGNMERMICNKFGCRVVQFGLEKLTKDFQGDVLKAEGIEGTLIRNLLDKLSKKAYRYSQDEYANYIIQYVLKHRSLQAYRDRIIKTALIGNIVVLSQAKFSSHVVEQAFEHASDNLFEIMIKEVFGSIVNPKNGRDCLDQMLFDQYGNYVIQRLLNMAIKIRHGKRQGKAPWFDALSQRIIHNAHALLKYSSGKKIIETVSVELGYSII